MTTYTAQAVQVQVGLLPSHRRIVTQFHVLADGEYSGQWATLEEAQEEVDRLNNREAEFADWTWKDADQNVAG